MQSTYVSHAQTAEERSARGVQPFAKPAALSFWFVLVLLAGVAIRLPGIVAGTGHGYDHWTMQVWTRAMVEHPHAEFYALELEVPQDHLPGDLLMFAGIGRFLTSVVPGIEETNYPDRAVIKAVAVLADFVIGALIYGIVNSFRDQRAALLAMAAFLLSPGVMYVSAIWGQWDAVSAAFAIGAISLAMRSGWLAASSWPVLAYACLIKPQNGLFGPFLLLHAWKREGVTGLWRSGFGIVAGLGLVQAVSSMFDIGLPGVPARWSLLDRIFASVGEYDAISLNGHNLWILPIGRGAPFSDQGLAFGGITYQALGTALFVLALAVILWCAARFRDPQTALAWGSAATMMVMFVTMTRMHERYLFPALPLIVIAAVLLPRLRVAAVAVHLAYVMNVHMAFTNNPSGWAVVQNDLAYCLNALVVIGAFLYVIGVGVIEAKFGRSPRAASNQIRRDLRRDALPHAHRYG